MRRSIFPRQWRRVATAVLLVSGLTTLVGCSNAPLEDSSTNVTPAATTATTPVAQAPSESASASTPGLEGLPVDKSCADLLSTEDLYKFSPNFAVQDSATPATGTSAAEAISLQGISCSYVNLSGGDTITLSLARLTPASISMLNSRLAGTGSPADSYVSGPVTHAYFSTVNGGGQVDLVTNSYWLSCSSSLFSQPQDAMKLLSLVTPHLS